MSFTIFPAVDIKEGKCVRLFQGDFNLVSNYYDDPLMPALKFIESGSKWLHIIDLDGARTGHTDNIDVIKRILIKSDINIQVGGGIRTLKTAKTYLEAGAKRIILGSAVLKEPGLLKEFIKAFGPEKVVVSLDGRNGQLFTEGWQKASGKKFLEITNDLAEDLKTIIYTDIERDGTLKGPNIKNALELAEKTEKEVIVAGGIGTEKDVLELAKYQKRGIKGAVIGRALYTGSINLENLVKRLGEEH